MDPRDVLRVPVREAGGDEGPPVATVHAEAAMAEDVDHQVAEAVRRVVGAEARVRRRPGESVPR